MLHELLEKLLPVSRAPAAQLLDGRAHRLPVGQKAGVIRNECEDPCADADWPVAKLRYVGIGLVQRRENLGDGLQARDVLQQLGGYLRCAARQDFLL